MGLEREGVVYNPLSFGGPGYGSGYGNDMFGGGGLMGGLLLASLLGGRRGGLFGGEGVSNGGDVLAGDVASKVVELQNTADLKYDVKSVESNLRESILNQTIGFGNEFRGLEGKIDRAATDAVKAQYESKIASLESTNILSNKIGHVETEIQAVKCQIDNKINHSTQTILNHLNADKLDSKNDEISELRSRNRHMEQTILFGNQLNSITSSINSMDQRLTNQVVQFGTGNLATPTATNNQVK